MAAGDMLKEISARLAFDAVHVYSASSEAAVKRALDERIMGGSYTQGSKVNIADGSYLQQLISLASAGKTAVSSKAKGLQFYLVKGGAEGFLDPWYKGRDASRVVSSGRPTTAGKPGTVMVFDNNDLLAVFSAAGTLIASAALERPLSIAHPNIWTEGTANKIYDAWNGRQVSLYRNQNFSIKYYGLKIDDKLGWYAKGRVRVDLHKQEATNGCIFILDPATPSLQEKAKLNAFEPALIRAIQAHIGAKTSSRLGIMHVVTI